jgi:hypothetical protein
MNIFQIFSVKRPFDKFCFRPNDFFRLNELSIKRSSVKRRFGQMYFWSNGIRSNGVRSKISVKWFFGKVIRNPRTQEFSKPSVNERDYNPTISQILGFVVHRVRTVIWSYTQTSLVSYSHSFKFLQPFRSLALLHPPNSIHPSIQSKYSTTTYPLTVFYCICIVLVQL